MDLSKTLYGTHIRVSELAKNLNIKLVHSNTRKRPLKYTQSIPALRGQRELLLLGHRGRFFDILFFNALKRSGIKIIYDVADIPHLQNFYFEGGTINTNLYRRFYALVNLADVLLFVSESALSLMTTDSLKEKRTLIIPNASDPTFFQASPIQDRAKTILYVGGYALARGVDDLVSAFHNLEKKYPDTKLRLVGANIPKKFGSERILVNQDKIYKDMRKVHTESYLCVIPHKKNPYMNAALPVKLFDAMASARPVVVTDCLEMKKLVEMEKCGLVAYDNPLSIADAIEYLLVNPEVAREMGRRGREAILKRHSWKHRAEAILHNFKEY